MVGRGSFPHSLLRTIKQCCKGSHVAYVIAQCSNVLCSWFRASVYLLARVRRPAERLVLAWQQVSATRSAAYQQRLREFLLYEGNHSHTNSVHHGAYAELYPCFGICGACHYSNLRHSLFTQRFPSVHLPGFRGTSGIYHHPGSSVWNMRNQPHHVKIIWNNTPLTNSSQWCSLEPLGSVTSLTEQRATKVSPSDKILVQVAYATRKKGVVGCERSILLSFTVTPGALLPFHSGGGLPWSQLMVSKLGNSEDLLCGKP